MASQAYERHINRLRESAIRHGIYVPEFDPDTLEVESDPIQVETDYYNAVSAALYDLEAYVYEKGGF